MSGQQCWPLISCHYGRGDCRFFEHAEGVRSCLEVFAKPLEPIVLQAVEALGTAA